MKEFKPNFKILPEGQRKIWPLLSPLKTLNYVLYGGTAIALQLGHRSSVDFDFFSHTSLNKERLLETVPILKGGESIQDASHTLSLLVNGVKLSFFNEIKYGRVNDPSISSDKVAYTASLEDLLATKLIAVVNRVEAKDYKDIVALTSSGIPLSRGLAAARRMVPMFQPQDCLRALTFFEGGDLRTLARSDKVELIETVKGIRELPQELKMSDGLLDSADVGVNKNQVLGL